MDTFLHVVNEALLLYLGITALYMLIMAVAAQFNRSQRYPRTERLHRFAILIPENSPLPDMGDYPKDLYQVIPCRDLFETVQTLDESMFGAVVVLGPFDHLSPDFLFHVNRAFEGGVRVIQLHHVIEPRKTLAKKLAALREEISNAFFRQGHTGVGFSSALDGTDMVLELAWLKKNMKSARTNLEMRLLKQNVFIEYLEDVIVYSPQPRQRPVLARSKAASRFFEVLFSGRWGYTSRLFQRFLPSFGLALGLSLLMMLIFAFVDWTESLLWCGMALFLLFVMSLGIPDYLVEKKKKSKKTA